MLPELACAASASAALLFSMRLARCMGAGEQLSARMCRGCALQMPSLLPFPVPQFMGLCQVPPAIVTEYCARGSLYSCLQAARANPAAAAELTWARRLSMVGCCACPCHAVYCSKLAAIGCVCTALSLRGIAAARLGTLAVNAQGMSPANAALCLQ